jgi:hypothetical protein
MPNRAREAYFLRPLGRRLALTPVLGVPQSVLRGKWLPAAQAAIQFTDFDPLR